VGPNAATTWSITGTDAGSLKSSPTPNVTFASFRNLTCGAGPNTFRFNDGARIAGNLIGGGGPNTLDDSASRTSVLVNLRTGRATGVGGSVEGIQNVIGGHGGGAAGAYNILVGNGGNTLTGGNGRRNLLIAGPGGSTLLGGDGDDLLIGGSTAYDLETDCASLRAVMAEWTRTDEDYTTRVAHVTNGIGVPFLGAPKVTSNGASNTLTGGPGRDLFYGNVVHDTYDRDPSSERFVSV
jgi:Ca2+-binding RTX toxin-like protein